MFVNVSGSYMENVLLNIIFNKRRSVIELVTRYASARLCHGLCMRVCMAVPWKALVNAIPFLYICVR